MNELVITCYDLGRKFECPLKMKYLREVDERFHMFDSIKEILHIVEPIIKKPPDPTDVTISFGLYHVLLKIRVTL